MLPYLRLAQLTDLPMIEQIITDAKKLLHDDQIDQWQNGQPNKTQFVQDIQQQNCWVLCQHAKIVGTATLMFQADPNYQIIYDGRWSSDAPYAVIHRFAVQPAANGQHFGRYLFSNLLSQGCRQNYTHFRIDTHPDNLRMQHLIMQAGFQNRGWIQLQNEQQAPRLAYELDLDI
ncbi:GNAT family N-acetyltransferase [Bombilactobacillus folatiphilus]|uniref:GNAT family N-acetyltransferase n=1 Tax=Bombilactobacillus folatiphilus TaxID=2923362 RepID=A0ABY4P994_9LACO|nr:GNAT family N-acetyltransferase [Bombilactobacillus folatiphilus]UQS82165.1 GNAT family N-acetyltransferase [Bombilactobacillus folatiphilus]